MKKNLLGVLALLAANLLLLPSGLFAQDSNSVVAANNQFAFELYSKYKSKSGNIFFSPYSISSAIAMTYEGAKGKTADEILSVFHFPKDDFLRRKSFRKLNGEINKKDKKYELRIANALWAEKDCVFLNDYFKLIEDYFDGKAANLDFLNEAEKSRLTINNWVEGQTNFKIKDLIPQDMFNLLPRLVITNAVYFKGSWLTQFDKKNTRDENFKLGSGITIKTPMMYLDEVKTELNYAQIGKLQILELPYEGRELSMLIILPQDNDLKTVEDFLSAEKLSEWKRLLKKEKVLVYLPKFKFETKYFMAGDLIEMGIPTAFSLSEADFSGMTGNRALFISQVIHQAFVEINEEGTEAAAATAVMMRTIGL